MASGNGGQDEEGGVLGWSFCQELVDARRGALAALQKVYCSPGGASGEEAQPVSGP